MPQFHTHELSKQQLSRSSQNLWKKTFATIYLDLIVFEAVHHIFAFLSFVQIGAVLRNISDAAFYKKHR